MLRLRIATALILLPLALALILSPYPAVFASGVGVVVLLAGREWAGLINLRRVSSKWNFLALLALVMGLLYGGAPDAGLLLAAAVGTVWWILAGVWLSGVRARDRAPGPVPAGLGVVGGCCVLVPAWSALVWLHAQPDGVALILLLFALIWAADIGAYLTGRRFGRRKLAPAISPGKTVEGLLGGLVLALVVALSVPLWLPQDSLLPGLLPLALITVCASVIGDLLESAAKRAHGVKDSGWLLPGHGGVLDRVDSLTAAAPVFAVLLHWLGGVA